MPATPAVAPELIFELLLWAVFALALRDGLRRLGLRQALLFFVPLFCYGWVLEESAIAVFQRYAYSDRFVATLFDAPLCIAAGWSAITYSGLVIGQALLGREQRAKVALFVALWGLSIDLSMDAVAVYLGFWTWFHPADVVLPYFAVPVSNFVGWFIILFCFTYFHQLGRGRRWRRWLVGFDAALPALPVLLLAIHVMIASEYERAFTNLTWYQMAALVPLPLMLALGGWLVALVRRKAATLELGGLRAPLCIAHAFHLFCLAAALYLGTARGDWRYLAVGAIALLPLAALHLAALRPAAAARPAPGALLRAGEERR